MNETTNTDEHEKSGTTDKSNMSGQVVSADKTSSQPVLTKLGRRRGRPSKVIAESLTWKQDYHEYCANFLDTRTEKQFCDDANITQSSLTRYKRDKREEIYRQADKDRQKHMSEFRALAYRCLSYRMKVSDNALKMALQILGELVEKTESKYTFLSPDEKRDKIREIMSKIGPVDKSMDKSDKPVLVNA